MFSSSLYSSYGADPSVDLDSFLPPASSPAVSVIRRTPQYQHSVIQAGSQYVNKEKHKKLLYPPWLAIANATRTLPAAMTAIRDVGGGINRHGEMMASATLIQRAFRGFNARFKVWRYGGEGTQYMATKIQVRASAC